jgi:hypothetical protein
MMKNKKGMYEYILTKSVMLIFILSIVYLFYSFYNTMNLKSANDIAQMEAEKIAKEIDDAMGYVNIDQSRTIRLNPQLKVGNSIVPYELEILPSDGAMDSMVILSFIDHPYNDVVGIATFAQGKLELAPSIAPDSKIDCTWNEIMQSAEIRIIKEDEFYYDSTSGHLRYRATVELDAATSCQDYLRMVADYEYA